VHQIFAILFLCFDLKFFSVFGAIVARIYLLFNTIMIPHSFFMQTGSSAFRSWFLRVSKSCPPATWTTPTTRSRLRSPRHSPSPTPEKCVTTTVPHSHDSLHCVFLFFVFYSFHALSSAFHFHTTRFVHATEPCVTTSMCLLRDTPP